MILATAIVTGFQNEIRDKVIGFGSHIQITHFSDGNSYESKKVSQIDSIKQSLAPIAEVIHIQEFATKAGIIKTSQEIKGVVLKGVGSDFNATFLRIIFNQEQYKATTTQPHQIKYLSLAR